ncbi:siderophore-interacting protein [Actinomycetospora termitidis]|uniref:Siderophore-interacting protein n=1 Tax=Actinomycetospora termitidis TaxID=3053470 RepID=A0ABT7MFT1_9PSEU|nr:siderophore-interacting protein [Actinomycetospora sp. Odt1-22]MDL5159531.1 siderophore-interacting protein [Actinomycetospora sp. Odt1-22]
MTSSETAVHPWIESAPAPVERELYAVTPRLAEVVRVVPLTPRMTRVTLSGDFSELLGRAPTDHVKVFFPPAGEELPVMPQVGPNGLIPPPPGSPRLFRDYTLRRVDRAGGEIDIDMVLHAGGLGSTWAAAAAPGMKVGVLGPRGSEVVDPALDWLVLAGDETALPAIGRWLAELPSAVSVRVVVEVAGPEEEQTLPCSADVDLVWLHRNGIPAGESTLLADALAGFEFEFPTGRGFVWVAGEAVSLKPVRRMLRNHPALDAACVDVDGYWRRGVVNHDHHAASD